MTQETASSQPLRTSDGLLRFVGAFVFAGVSINDISKALDRTDSWTKVNLLRARKALEVEMNRENKGSEAYG